MVSHRFLLESMLITLLTLHVACSDLTDKKSSEGKSDNVAPLSLSRTGLPITRMAVKDVSLVLSKILAADDINQSVFKDHDRDEVLVTINELTEKELKKPLKDINLNNPESYLELSSLLLENFSSADLRVINQLINSNTSSKVQESPFLTQSYMFSNAGMKIKNKAAPGSNTASNQLPIGASSIIFGDVASKDNLNVDILVNESGRLINYSSMCFSESCPAETKHTFSAEKDNEVSTRSSPKASFETLIAEFDDSTSNGSKTYAAWKACIEKEKDDSWQQTYGMACKEVHKVVLNTISGCTSGRASNCRSKRAKIMAICESSSHAFCSEAKRYLDP